MSVEPARSDKSDATGSQGCRLLVRLEEQSQPPLDEVCKGSFSSYACQNAPIHSPSPKHCKQLFLMPFRRTRRSDDDALRDHTVVDLGSGDDS